MIINPSGRFELAIFQWKLSFFSNFSNGNKVYIQRKSSAQRKLDFFQYISSWNLPLLFNNPWPKSIVNPLGNRSCLGKWRGSPIIINGIISSRATWVKQYKKDTWQKQVIFRKKCVFVDKFWEVMKKNNICKVTCLVIFDLFDQFKEFQKL